MHITYERKIHFSKPFFFKSKHDEGFSKCMQNYLANNFTHTLTLVFNTNIINSFVQIILDCYIAIIRNLLFKTYLLYGCICLFITAHIYSGNYFEFTGGKS